MENFLEIITEKKTKLDSYRPFSSEVVKKLDDWFKVELTYTSNALEDNSLTRDETALIIEKGQIISGKSEKERLEVTNYVQALNFIKQLETKKKNDLATADILTLHEILFKDIDDENAGKLRVMDIKSVSSDSVYPKPVLEPDPMNDFIDWLHGSQDHPVKVAIEAHFKIMTFQPFLKGNGKVARLLLCLLLIQEGYPPALIQKEDQHKYFDSIKKAAQKRDFSDYCEVMYQAVDRGLDSYLKAL